MQNMLMGRYIPGDSIIHRMDPRSKLLVMIAFVVIIFLAHDWLGYLLLVLYTPVRLSSQTHTLGR